MKKARTLPMKVTFALLGLVILLLLAAIGVVYRSYATRIAALDAQLTAKQAQLAGAQACLAREPVLQREYESLKATLAVLEPALTSEEFVPTFLGQIEKLGVATGNQVTGVKPDRETTNAGPRSAQTAEAGTTPLAAGTAGAAGAQPPAPARSLVADYERMPLEVTIKGDYWSIARFVKAMSQFPKLVAVNELNITAEGGDADPTHPKLDARVDMLALIRKGGEQWTSVAKK